MGPFQASAIGSRADMAAGVEISKVHGGYFSNPENTRQFCEIGLVPIQAHLPSSLLYIDAGGGEGFLCQSVLEYLQRVGYVVGAIVADGNQQYLDRAQARKLKTVLCNLEDGPFTGVDLITMRAVLHYNTPERQVAILRSMYQALKEGGYLVHQVSSGSDVNSKLRSAIVNIPELGRAGAGNYHWTSLNETIDLHTRAGFLSTELVGYAAPASWGPVEQWDRFNRKRFEDAQAREDVQAVAEIEQTRLIYLEKANGLIAEYERDFDQQETGIEQQHDGSYLIHYQYPIIVSRK